MSGLKDTAEEIMEQARDAGADDVVVEVFDHRTNQVRYSNSRIDASNWWSLTHAHVFVAVGKRTLSTDLLDMGSAKASVEALVKGAKMSPENSEYTGIASGRFKYKRGRADPRIVAMRSPTKHVHDAISAAAREGAMDVGGTLFVRHLRAGIASSGGARAEDEGAALELSVRAFSQPEASGHALCCTHKLSGLDARATGSRAGQMAFLAKDPVQGDEGKMDIILEPMFLGELINSTTHMLSAFYVEVGMSMFAKKIGKKVASSEVTMADDPTIPSTSQRAFDHEGVPTKRTVVIDKGVLKTYLHDTSTAKRFKTRTTGNAGPFAPLGLDQPGVPIPFHPVVEPGDWSVEEMIADTKDGLYLNNAWYTRFQSYSMGDFSTIPRDALLKIEDGRIVGAVKNIRVSDNMLSLWKNIDALSKAREEVYWWDEVAPPSHLPTVRARGMNITRSS
ncbi:MAG: TldD/PmbA family protein [Thermoplasmata archaeon]